MPQNAVALHVESELRRPLEAALLGAENPVFAGLDAFGGDGYSKPVSNVLRTSCGLSKIIFEHPATGQLSQTNDLGVASTSLSALDADRWPYYP